MSQNRKSTTHEHNLEARIAMLEELFVRFAQTGAVEHMLGQGFELVSGHLCTVSDRLELIAAELEPLRKLNGTPINMTDEQQAILDNLRAAHARPTFRGLNALTVEDVSVRFIGDLPSPPPSHCPQLENRSLAS